jgi:hypothetical protein
MDLGRHSLSLTIAGLGTVFAAAALIWLLLYEPATLARALEEGDGVAVLQLLGRTLASAIWSLVRYL